MEIKGNKYYFAKTWGGRKYHIFPMGLKTSLCSRVWADSESELNQKELDNNTICKACQKHYHRRGKNKDDETKY